MRRGGLHLLLWAAIFSGGAYFLLSSPQFLAKSKSYGRSSASQKSSIKEVQNQLKVSTDSLFARSKILDFQFPNGITKTAPTRPPTTKNSLIQKEILDKFGEDQEVNNPAQAENTPPVAKIVKIFLDNTKKLALLDGRYSQDPDNQLLDFQWYVIGCPERCNPNTLNSPTAPATEVNFDLNGVYTIGLVVFDSAGERSPPAHIVLNVGDSTTNPIAIITDEKADYGSRLSAQQSYSYPPGPLKYNWEVLAAPNDQVLGILNVAKNTDTAELAMTIPGIYRISLTVTDVKGRSGSTEWTYHQSASNHMAEPIENIEDRTVHLGEKIILGPDNPPAYLKSMRWAWSVIHAPTDATITTANNSQYIFTPTQAGNYLLRLTVTAETGTDFIQHTVHVSVIAENKLTIAQKSTELAEPPKEQPATVAYAGKDQLHCFTPMQTIINLDGSKSSVLTDGTDSVSWSLTNPGLAKFVTILNQDQLNAQALIIKPGRYEFRLSLFQNKSLAAEDQTIIQLLPSKLRLPAFKGEWPPDIEQSSLPEWYGTLVVRAFDPELLKLRPLTPQKIVSFQYHPLVIEKKYLASYQLIYGGTPIDPKNISIPKAIHQTFWGWFDLPKEYHEYPKRIRLKYSVTQVTETGSNKFTHEMEPIPETIYPTSIPNNADVDRIYITEKMRLAGQDIAEFTSSHISNRLHYIRYLPQHNYFVPLKPNEDLLVYKEIMEGSQSCFMPFARQPIVDD